MLSYDPAGRIDPIQIVSHPWITGLCKEQPGLMELMRKSSPPSVKPANVQVWAVVAVEVCVLLLSRWSVPQQDYDLHNGVLHGLGIVTVDAAKLSGEMTIDKSRQRRTPSRAANSELN
jgi:hypothetical protein